MAAKTFWHYDVAVSGFGKLDEGSAPTAANTSSKASGTINSNICGFADDYFSYGTQISFVDCDGNGAYTPGIAAGNCLRSLNTLSGTFATGTWTFTANIIGAATIANTNFGFTWRLYRSSNADGSSATEISSNFVKSTKAYTNTAGDITSNQSSLPAVTLTNEYLFVSLSWTCDTTRIINTVVTGTLRVGTTKLDTPNFSPIYNDTLSESVTAADSYVAIQTFACPLDELACGQWNTPAGVILWGASTGDWGHNLQLYTPNIVFAAIPLSEAATPTDSYVGNTVFPNSLSEPVTPVDSFVPNLVIEKTLSEAVAAADSITAKITFNLSLTEPLADYWGTSGILWGGSTGTWANQALDSLSAIQVFACPLTESVTASDTLSGLAIFPNTLSEPVTSLDVYVPGLVMPVVITEAGTVADALTANNVMAVTLVEALTNYWGSAGILWGATTGTWGGDVQDSLSSQMVFNPTLVEVVTALDTVVAVQVFVSSLSESVTATDSLIPNLVITQTLTEAGGAIDLLVAQQVFRNFLLEFGTAADLLSFSITGSTSVIVVVDPTLTVFGAEFVEDPLGVDIFCFPDLDPLGVLVKGITALAQRVARRLTNSRGTWFWAPNECTDTRQFLNDTLTQERISLIKNEIEREVLREEAVKTVNSTVTFDVRTSVLDVKLVGVTSEGPFSFVFEITSSKLTILN